MVSKITLRVGNLYNYKDKIYRYEGTYHIAFTGEVKYKFEVVGKENSMVLLTKKEVTESITEGSK